MKAYWGSGGIATLIFEWSASRPGRSTSQAKSPWYPLDRSLGEPQSRFGRESEEKNSQPPQGIEP
jgi:hypothetical protein